MKQKPSISIGIPAYNEAQVIATLLRALIRQQQEKWTLKEILVFSDGSTDGTEGVAAIGNSLVRVLHDPVRRGQQVRQNQILETYAGDVLVILEADVLPYNDATIEELVEALRYGEEKNVAMAVGETVILPPKTFLEKVLFWNSIVKKRMFNEWRSGDNIYSSGGQAMKALTRVFTEKLRWPEHVPEDAYTYLYLKKIGMSMVKNKKALVYMKNVTTVRNRLKQNRKFVSGRRALKRYFKPSTVRAAYALPRTLILKHVGKACVEKPITTIFCLLEICVSRLLTLFGPQFTALYEPCHSSHITIKELEDISTKFNGYHDSNENIPIALLAGRQARVVPEEGKRLVKLGHQVTVEVAVSAYNEEQNIAKFLESLLSQREDGFTLNKILVISDGSTDQTAQIARSIDSPKIEVKEYTKRKGQPLRLNKIYASLEANILVKMDADVVLAHAHVIRDLIRPLINELNVAMCGGNPQPLKARTFTERAVNCTYEAYAPFRESVRGGNNVFSAEGRILAFRRELANTIHVPENMIANDMYAYLYCITRGYRYRHVPSAVVYFRSPQSLRDQIRQNTRFVSGPSRMERYFPPALVRYERSVPTNMFFRSIMRQYFLHPILSSYIFAVNGYCRVRALFLEKKLSGTWDMAHSTKTLQKEPRR